MGTFKLSNNYLNDKQFIAICITIYQFQVLYIFYVFTVLSMKNSNRIKFIFLSRPFALVIIILLYMKFPLLILKPILSPTKNFSEPQNVSHFEGHKMYYH